MVGDVNHGVIHVHQRPGGKANTPQLWMGTHPNVPTKLQSSQETLSAHLKANPELMGAKIHKAFPDSKDGSLPFLFKVLSIGTALSIQAHPDKTLAERLHRERGDVYKGEWELGP